MGHGAKRKIGRWGDGETRRKRINSKAQSFYEIQTVKNLILTSKYLIN
jgi:hypothetical protein